MPEVWGTADGTNGSARFFAPEGIVVDGGGAVFVMDSGDHAIREISASGTNWVVTTVAGLPGVSGSANGTGATTRFRYAAGLALDNAGYLYVADAGQQCNSCQPNGDSPAAICARRKSGEHFLVNFGV